MLSNVLLHEVTKLDVPVASAAPVYMSVAESNRQSILLFVVNAATVTGGAVTLLQAQDAAGLNAKALALDCAFVVNQASGNVAPVTIVANSDTFTTDTTDNVTLCYEIPIDGACLDVNNGFTHVQVQVAGEANTVITVQNAQYSLRAGR